jgi:hypothetical protein
MIENETLAESSMGKVRIDDRGAIAEFSALALGLTRQGCVNLRKLLNNGLELFRSRTVCLATGGAPKYAGTLEPSESLIRLVSAVRAGDWDLNLFVEDFFSHNSTPTKGASCASASGATPESAWPEA